MRIVGGQWRGRAIKAPKGDSTRPTTDRVREALFSALTSRLGADLGGAIALDAFAGSGALGLEALSRGARSAVFVEQHRDALRVLRSNVSELGADARSTVVPGNLFTLAERGISGPFSLILLDPPYTLDPSKVAEALAALVRTGGVEHYALATWEHATGYEPMWPEGFVLDVRKRYGSTEVDIAVYERGAGE